jgi:hypothetical protein
MNRLLGALIASAAVCAAAQSGDAQVYQVYYPAPTTTYYQPAPVTTYYAPAPTTVYYSQPVATTYYRRPLIGGTISGWRYNAAPVTYVYPSTVAYYPAW